jgi:L-alanine-DL-glutamate epimerase-like enolase superfamily enzyme
VNLTRRHFLYFGGSSALARPVAGAGPRIARLEIFPVSYPVKGHFKFFDRPERPAVFVKLTAADGSVGWGQSAPLPSWSYESVETVSVTLEKYLAPVIVGRDPFDLPGAHAAMNRAIASSFSTGMPIAKAGVDLALHDLTGRLSGKSIPALWDRQPLDRIALSWTVNPASFAEIDELVEQGRKRGYRAFNVKVSPDAQFDVELCRRVKQLAPNTFLWADANGGYDLATALAVAPRFADVGVNVFEQPVPPNRLTGLQELKKQGALPIILDEGVVNSAEPAEFIKLKMLDGVAMKPARTAGLFDARKQVEMLEKEGLIFLGSGLTDPDLSLAAALQLYAAYGLKYPAALNGPQFLEGTYLKKPLEVRGGAIDVPGGAGLGAEVDEAALRRPLLSSQVSVPSAWALEDLAGASLRITHSGKPVCVYNYGMMLAPGAPPSKRRSSYLHPVWAPNGVILTDDFPKDHFHHRGISWMWPVVNLEGNTYDPWIVEGIQTRFVRWLARDTRKDSARLAVENGWYLDGRNVLREEVEIVATADGLALRLSFDPLVPLEIGGTHEGNKGYGGLCFRFAPRKNTVLTTDKGREAGDTDLVPHPWAQIEGEFAGGRAAARIDIDSGNPAYPNGWCLREYGFLGVNYPGLDPVALTPGKPLVMKYRVTLMAR